MSSLGIFYKETKTYKKVAGTAEVAVVDAEMSDTSENPVQNKVIKKYVDDSNTAKLDKTSVVDNQITSEAGYALDARQANPNVEGSLGAQIKTVNETVDELKKSVSDGKTKVANAITDKGVETATDATFDVMAENISKIETGTKLNLYTQTSEPSKKDGIWVKTSNQYEKAIVDNRILSSGGVWNNPVLDLPYSFYSGSAVVYNGEIHILGSSSSSSGSSTSHYKWNGSSWTNVSNLPYRFYYGSAVVYNGEIHILGGSVSSGSSTSHYKWNGSSWTNVSNLPYSFYSGSAVVYNGEIHILGSSDSETSHYKWNGSSWTNVSKLPYRFYYGSAVVYNGEIHILGGVSSSSTSHYKWNGSSWTNVSKLPYSFYYGSAVVYNGEIHILGSVSSGSETSHYKWNGSSWTNVSKLPYRFYNGSAVVYNGQSIYILGSDISQYYKCRATFTSLAKTYDPYTLIIQRGDTNNGVYVTAFADMSAIAGRNNRFQTGFDDAWYFGSSAFETTPIYYGDGSKWIKFKN